MRPDPAIPLGHSTPAHRDLGWCFLCPGRSLAEEVTAWQLDAQDRHTAQDTDPQYLSAVTDWATCPTCEEDGVLSVVTVTVRTTTGPKRAGGWTYCIACEAAPGEADHARP